MHGRFYVTPQDRGEDHVPVLVRELLELLAPRCDDVVLDCTVGLGGHAAAIAQSMRLAGPVTGRILGVDLDHDLLARAAQRVVGVNLTPIHDTFARAPARVAALGLRATILLADLGFNSAQMDDPRRGFAFGHEGPLDMRFDRSAGPTAADLVAQLSQRELTDLLHRCGEEPLAARIARNLVRARAIRPIQTTTQLGELVREAYGPRARSSRLHPATRTFMALRIAVNDELGALDALLDQVARAARSPRPTWLADGARVAVISFHSLEDRAVKRAFAGMVAGGVAVALTRKPVRPGEMEMAANPRSRSAKLRAVRLSVARMAAQDAPVHKG
jgi:16S rRNA (cytosine1402-N4)-methyltransferase